MIEWVPGKRRPKGHCQLCGVFRESLHQDHILPKAMGGAEDPSNYQYICANCHEDKTRIDLLAIFQSKPLAQRKAEKAKFAMANKDKKFSAEHKAKIQAGMMGNQNTKGLRWTWKKNKVPKDTLTSSELPSLQE